MSQTALNDRMLIDSLRAGDERAFAELVDRYGAAMLRVARAQVSSDDDAGEVVQEAWIVALRSMASFEERSSLKTWLLGIAHNVARSRRRRDARRAAIALVLSAFSGHDRGPTVDAARFHTADDPRAGTWRLPPAEWSDLPESRLLGKEAREEIAQAIAALPEAQRVVMELRDIEGLDAGEVARIVGITPANVRVRLHRGRATVRARLERYFGEVRG